MVSTFQGYFFWIQPWNVIVSAYSYPDLNRFGLSVTFLYSTNQNFHSLPSIQPPTQKGVFDLIQLLLWLADSEGLILLKYLTGDCVRKSPADPRLA